MKELDRELVQEAATADPPAQKPKKKKRRKWDINEKTLVVLASLGLIWLGVFCYAPMFGAALAFKDADMRLDVWDALFTSEWVGFYNFREFFIDPNFAPVFWNTLGLNTMDMGADSLLLPMTNGAEEIRQVVKYAKYSPLGERGISTMRAHTLYNPPPLKEYMRTANARTRVYAQIETVAGVEHIDEILAVEGVAGFFMGPNDLSDAYGCPGEKAAPQILEAIGKTAESARRHKKTSGIITENAAYLQRAREAGMTMFSCGSELSLLAAGLRNTVAHIKG